MLTILIRYRKTRVEVLKRAESVEYTPPAAVDSEHPENTVKNEHPGLLLTREDDGEHLPLTPMDDDNYRDVFVMNEQGATVARYTL